MADFTHQDLSGSTFEDVDLSGSRLRNVVLDGARFRGVWARTLELDGELGELVVNDIDVMPLWRAEMVRRHPEFALLRPTTADGYREAWPILQRQWSETVERARRLPEEALHERVEGEWSFVETLRHLVFATDAWIRRAYLGDPHPFDPLGLPHEDMEPGEGIPVALDAARPSLDEIVALRADRQATMTAVLADLTDERLDETTAVVTEPGYPESEAFPVSRVLSAILSEEWWHRRFAERDLAALEARLTPDAATPP